MAKYQRGTFIIVPNNHALKGLSPESQAVFMWICFHSDEYGRCFPSRTTLANESGCSVRTVDNSIETLINKGILLKKTRKDGKKNLTSIYQIMIVEKEETEYFDGGVVQEVHEGSAGGALGVVQEVQRELNPLEPNILKKEKNLLFKDFETFCEENNYKKTEYYAGEETGYEDGYSHPSRRRPFTTDEVISKYNKFIKSKTGQTQSQKPQVKESIDPVGKLLTTALLEAQGMVKFDRPTDPKVLTSFIEKFKGLLRTDFKMSDDEIEVGIEEQFTGFLRQIKTKSVFHWNNCVSWNYLDKNFNSIIRSIK